MKKFLMRTIALLCAIIILGSILSSCTFKVRTQPKDISSADSATPDLTTPELTSPVTKAPSQEPAKPQNPLAKAAKLGLNGEGIFTLYFSSGEEGAYWGITFSEVQHVMYNTENSNRVYDLKPRYQTSFEDDEDDSSNRGNLKSVTIVFKKNHKLTSAESQQIKTYGLEYTFDTK